MNTVLRLLCILILSIGNIAASQAAMRVKDIATFHGVRENQLIGYGLVIGLPGTGDSLRNAPFTRRSLISMLERLGINPSEADFRTRNIAAVVATARLPAFVGQGSAIDVNVSSLGDASSLAGGTLVMTPLLAPNGVIYAVAQGPLTVSGFAREGQAESLTQGVPTAARIPNGAIVERDPAYDLADIRKLKLELRNADFKTAINVTDAINKFARRTYGYEVAIERNSRIVELKRPDNISPARFMAQIGDLRVKADLTAKVVIDESTGTIVIGHNVKISTVAVTHGNLTVRISETPVVSQPEPFSEGETTVKPRTLVDATVEEGRLAILSGTDLQTLVDGLNKIGLQPTGIIAILQTIKSAGGLHAELVVQ